MRREPIPGDFSGGDSSAREPAYLRVDGTGAASVLAQKDQRVLASARASDLDISSRIGNTARFVRFPDGGCLETTENDAVDELVRVHQPAWWRGLIHKLEDHLQFVLLTAVLVFGTLWWGVVYGVPWMSEKIAYQLPPDVLNTVSDESLALLDKTRFEPSELSEAERERLHNVFEPMLSDYSDLDLSVVFRSGGEFIGANAFALPDGTLVFTDEMVRLAQTDDQLLAVLAHEIGHVARRHSLRAVIQNSLLGFGYIMLVGDASAVSDLMVGLPFLAATLSYSRDHEREADAFAARVLDERGIEREAFISLMTRLGESKRCQGLLEDADRDGSDLSPPERLELCQKLQEEAERKDGEQSASWVNYLSTHPALEERLETFGRSD